MELPRGDDPQAKARRRAIYNDLIRTAEMPSRGERRARFHKMRTLALSGSETTERAMFNSLREWIGLSSSLIYSSEGTQFGLTYPPYYGGKDDARLTNDDLEQMVEKAREELHRFWSDCAFPEVVEAAVAQSHYADTAIVKVYASQRGLELGLLADPSDFAVGDEHAPWDQQEYMVHWYSLSLPQFWRLLRAQASDKEREAMWAKAIDHATAREHGRGEFLPPALGTILTAATSPNLVGNIVNYSESQLAIPRSKDPVVNLAELWVWDDRAAEVCDRCGERQEYWRHDRADLPDWPERAGGHEFKGSGHFLPDWRVATQFDATMEILWDPVNPMGVEGHPFFGLNLGDKDQAAGYVYGVAPMEHLIANQIARESKMAELNLRDSLDVNPPISAYGVPMRDGETTKGWRKPGGDIPLSQPNAKVEFHRPPPLADKFEFIRALDAERRLLQGIPHQIAQTDANVRSGEQAMTQAMMGAGPTLARAMAVERFMSGIATYALRVHRNMLERPLVKNDGSRFLLRQMPGDFIAKVWAHSASPIYTENLKALALAAHKSGLISDHAALRYLNLPGTDLLLREVEKMEKAKAERGQEVLDLKRTEVEAKKLKALK